MLKEFIEIPPIKEDSENVLEEEPNNEKQIPDLSLVHDEIEKIQSSCFRKFNEYSSNESPIPENIINGSSNKKFDFKLDEITCHALLKILPSGRAVEVVGSEKYHKRISRCTQSMTYPGTNLLHQQKKFQYQAKTRKQNLTGNTKYKKAYFATVLGDTSITYGKVYFEVTVNRCMDYKIGISYKHMQGSRIVADEENSWVLNHAYPDRFAAMHKNSKDFVFIPSHAASKALKITRIGVYLHYERGVLAFYNANNPSDRKHIYTFRTRFNRPVWPAFSLKQGKLTVSTGLDIPKNLTWKAKNNHMF